MTNDIDIDVIWECGDYEPDIPGDYAFTASFVESGWEYARDMPSATVTVLEDDQQPEENQPTTPTDGEGKEPALSFEFDGPLYISKTEHAGFADYSDGEKQAVFLADVRVVDGDGAETTDVDVTADFGEFDIGADAGTEFTVTYNVSHHLSREEFTSERRAFVTSGEIFITNFDPYPYSRPDDPDTHYITVEQGTAFADLPLPQTLKATVNGGEPNGYTR